jgi:hypothetical protein
MKRLDSCEGGHVTGLVKCDKDTVIMLLCIDTSRMHKCAAIAPSLGSKRPMRGRHGRPRPLGGR